MPILTRLPLQLKNLLRMWKSLLKHNGFPGEFGGSLTGMAVGLLGLLAWNPVSMIAMRQLAPALSLDFVNASLMLTSLMHFSALLINGRFGRRGLTTIVMACRWVGCIVLSWIWAALMFGFWDKEPWHAGGMLYLLMVYIYAYGGLYLFTNRTRRMG